MRLYNQNYSIDISPRPDGTHTLRFRPPPRFDTPPEAATTPTWPDRFCWALAVLIYPFYLTLFFLALVRRPRSTGRSSLRRTRCIYYLDKFVGRIAKRIGAEPPEAPE